MKKSILVLVILFMTFTSKAQTVYNSTGCDFVVYTMCTPQGDCSYVSDPPSVDALANSSAPLASTPCPQGPPPSIATVPNYLICWKHCTGCSPFLVGECVEGWDHVSWAAGNCDGCINITPLPNIIIDYNMPNPGDITIHY